MPIREDSNATTFRGADAILRGSGAMLRGADISWMDELEDRGASWQDRDNRSVELLDLLRRRGVNAVRLRTWVNPAGGYCGPERTIAIARRVKAAGFRLLLDIHYSDTWADPGHQAVPAAWTGFSGERLETTVYAYSRWLIEAMARESACPDLVQVGNEITNGMLWDHGRVGGAFESAEQWDRFARLLEAGIAGVRDGAGPGSRIEIIVHCDQGGDRRRTRHFYDRLAERGVEFDLIGLSYYPWWHGSLEAFSENLLVLARTYRKRILVVETAYPWTFSWNDNERNLVGEGARLESGFPASPEGQAEFLRKLHLWVAATPGGLGAGLFYWEPDAMTAPGHGSPWENMALFDFSGRELPGLEALGELPGLEALGE